MGLNFLQEQIKRQLSITGSTIVLGLDNDDAGVRALPDVAGLISDLELTAQEFRVCLPIEKDWNDWLKSGGTGKDVAKALDESGTWFSWLVHQAMGTDDPDPLKEVFLALARFDVYDVERVRDWVMSTLGISSRGFGAMLKDAKSELLEGGFSTYEVLGGRICRRTTDRFGGEVTLPLCNFDARIISDVVVDDGQDQDRRFVITGEQGGVKLPDVEVSAEEFGKMSWVLPQWGARAVVTAGSSTKDHLRNAIQVLSDDVATEYEYAHLGWRNIGGQWVYLTASGAVGMDGVNVSLPNEMGTYRLPVAPQEGVSDAVKLSLAMWDVGDYEATVPLWSAMYLAPLASIVPPSFTIWVFGTTGSMKSTLTALAMRHYGTFEYNNPSESWSSTEFALGRKAFLTKDAPLWIDDYTGQNTASGMNQIKQKADVLLRNWGNRTGRSRGRADGSLNTTNVPRGLVVGTAEQLPPGASIIARLYAIEMHPGMVVGGSDSALTKAQREESQYYTEAMAGYLTWIAEQYEELEKALPGRLWELTELAREGMKTHLRSAPNVATMGIGLEMGLKYAVSVGAIDADEYEGMWSYGWEILRLIGERQDADVNVEEDPIKLYFDAFNEMLSGGRIYLRHVMAPDAVERIIPRSRENNADLVGYYDDEYWYLIPKTMYKCVFKFYRESGKVFPDSERGVRAKMGERNIVHPEDGDRLTYRMRDEQRTTVLRIYRLATGDDGNKEDETEE